MPGRRDCGHREAFFSITRQSRWAQDDLAEHDVQYDSSIFPVYNYRYGMPRAARFPHALRSSLWELPIATVHLAGLNVPFGGGFYMRFWHYRFVRWAIARLNVQRQPAIVYFHPWEFDEAQPRLRCQSHWLAGSAGWRISFPEWAMREVAARFPRSEHSYEVLHLCTPEHYRPPRASGVGVVRLTPLLVEQFAFDLEIVKTLSGISAQQCRRPLYGALCD